MQGSAGFLCSRNGISGLITSVRYFCARGDVQEQIHWDRWRKCSPLGGGPQNSPSDVFSATSMGSRIPWQGPASATPDSQGQLPAGSRTSFNSSLIFCLNKGCSGCNLLWRAAEEPEKTANISAFPPRQPQSAHGETIPAGKVNNICSYYLCCDSSQSPNRSPNTIALRAFTHTQQRLSPLLIACSSSRRSPCLPKTHDPRTRAAARVTPYLSASPDVPSSPEG